MHVRKGDQVVVLSGDDKGKRGKVLRVDPVKGVVFVEGANYVWRHLRKSKKHPQGGRLQKEAPLAAGKVMLIDPATDRPTRIGHRLVDGRRVRWAKVSDKAIPAPVGSAR